jgi:hypothetical protein
MVVMSKLLFRTTLLMAFAGVLSAGSLHAEDTDFVQTNLISDLSGVAAITDPALKNP